MLFNTFALAASAMVASALTIKNRAAITDFETSPIHFEFPEARVGFNAETASKAACGGIPLGNRTNYPLSGGDLALTSRTSVDNLNFLYSKDADPTRFHSFATYTNSITDLGAGHYCSKGPDFASLGMKEGDLATMLVIYQLEGSKTYYYHCADVSLVAAAGFTTTDQYVCGNYTSEVKEASSEDSLHMSAMNATSNSTSGGTHGSSTSATSSVIVSATPSASAAAASSESSSSGLSGGAKAGIAVGVVVGVLALFGVLAYFFGWFGLNKKRNGLQLDERSVSSAGEPVMRSKA